MTLGWSPSLTEMCNYLTENQNMGVLHKKSLATDEILYILRWQHILPVYLCISHTITQSKLL